MKNLLISIAILFSMCIMSQANSTIPLENVLIKPENIKLKKQPVLFSHNIHEKYAKCVDCHHTEEYKGCMSSECHNTLDKKNDKYYKTIYHNTCYKNCHKTRKKLNLITGPTSCSKCHIKSLKGK